MKKDNEGRDIISEMILWVIGTGIILFGAYLIFDTLNLI